MHDSTDLAARNAKVARAFQTHNPAAFKAQRQAAGKRGYVNAGGVAWWCEQTDKARLWRIENPSEPEQILLALLSELTLVPFDREYIIDADPRAVDVAFAPWQCCIECTERETRASFGRNTQRDAKAAWLAAHGWNVHYFYYDADLQTETQRLATFLQEHRLIA